MPAFEFEGWRILVVDDDADSVDMFAELLKHEGGSVDKTQFPAHALRLLEAHDYDLPVSDVNMPEIDGYRLIERIRRLKPDRKLLAIAMTGYGKVADRERAERSGFDIHLCKPVTIARIKAAVARHLDAGKPGDAAPPGLRP